LTNTSLVIGTGCQLTCGPDHPVDGRRRLMSPIEQSESVTEEPVVEETLVEEVSIDGMCGVY